MKDFEIKDGVLVKYHGKDENVIIPDGVEKISPNAFIDNILEIRSIQIPDSVVYIDSMALIFCTRLKRIEVSDNNKFYTSFDGALFDKEMTKLIRYPNLKKEDYECVIPEGVVIIGEGAFYFCERPVIIIPNTVKAISQLAFGDCRGAKRIHYEGNEDDWNKIDITSYGNKILFNKKLTTIYFNSKKNS